MPIDRKLALESLKNLDKGVYEVYARLRDVDEYIQKEQKSFEKFSLYLISLDVLDDLETNGEVEIINDYEKRTIGVRKKC